MQKARTQGKRAQDRKPNIWVARANADRSFGAIFEDDGKTGFFYLCSLNPKEILSHVEIYQASELPFPMREEFIQIYWAEHGQRAALSIRGWPLAVFDIPSRKGWLLPELPEDASDNVREAALMEALVVE
jgi:hypothetical protein